jgi:exodeoxyribonuclease-1
MRRPLSQSFGKVSGVYTRFGDNYDKAGFDVVCYDTETSDADSKNAQIYQFGALFADRDLNVRDKAEVRIRRLPYVVPAPGAMKVTGLGLAEIDAADRLEEFEGAAEISRLLSFPPDVFKRLYITFNGLKYDDRLIQSTLDRNMLNYDFQQKPRLQGDLSPAKPDSVRTYRMDMLQVVRLGSVLSPNSIAIPLNDDGTQSMKLSDLAAANGIPIQAHDALGDARATLGLAKLVRSRMPAVWNVARRTSGIRETREWIRNSLNDRSPIWLHRHFGQAEVVPCVVVRETTTRVHLADLRRLDLPLPEDLEEIGTRGISNCPDCHLHDVKFVDVPFFLTEAEAEPVAAPFAVPVARELTRRYQAGEFEERIAELRRRIDTNDFREPPGATPEDFVHKDDKARRDAFVRAGDWADRARIEFASPRLRDYAARLVAMHCDLDALEAVIGARRVEQIRRDSAEAFRRPYAGKEAHWQTIEGACESEHADEAYRAWVEAAFDEGETHPRTVPPAEPEGDQPMLFRM